MGTSTPVQQKGTPLPTQKSAPTQQASTQQSGKGAAPTQISKDTFQAPTQAQKGVAVPKGAVTKGPTQGTCATGSTTLTSTSEDTCARVEDRTKHFFAGMRADLAGLGAEMESAVDNLEHMLGDFAGHVKGLLTSDKKTTGADCSGGAAETIGTCSTQGTQAQGQAQAQFSKGAPVKGAPTQQAPVQQAPTKGAPTQQAPVQQAPTKGAPTQQAPVQKGGK